MGANSNVLVIGGQRSGKSRFAEDLVARSGRRAVYLATATAGDGEMAERIAIHRGRRGGQWQTVEVPVELPSAIAAADAADAALLVDCLTLWLANLFAAERDVDRETDTLLAALRDASGPIVLVSNEVGAGIVPDNTLARRYADALGILNQRVAAAVGRVVVIAAGQPLVLKPPAISEIVL